MMRFSQCLEDVLARERWTRTKLAELCEVNLSNVARWGRGAALPKREVLARLVKAVSEEDAANLLAAWVLDSLPETAEAFLTVKPRKFNSKVSEEPSDAWPPGINAATRQKFLDFSKLAMKNPDVMEIVDVLHSAATRMRGKKE